MITGWPRWRPAISASLRRWVSVEPPAGHGTMSVMGRLGKSCACAADIASAANAASAARRIQFIGLLLRWLHFRLDAGGRDHLRPLRDLLVEEPRRLLRGRAERLDAQLLEARAQLGRLHGPGHLGAQAGDRLARRARGREDH